MTLRARWVTLRDRWVTLRDRWVTLRDRWVTLTSARCVVQLSPVPSPLPRFAAGQSPPHFRNHGPLVLLPVMPVGVALDQPLRQQAVVAFRVDNASWVPPGAVWPATGVSAPSHHVSHPPRHRSLHRPNNPRNLIAPMAAPPAGWHSRGMASM